MMEMRSRVWIRSHENGEPVIYERCRMERLADVDRIYWYQEVIILSHDSSLAAPMTLFSCIESIAAPFSSWFWAMSRTFSSCIFALLISTIVKVSFRLSLTKEVKSPYHYINWVTLPLEITLRRRRTCQNNIFRTIYKERDALVSLISHLNLIRSSREDTLHEPSIM